MSSKQRLIQTFFLSFSLLAAVFLANHPALAQSEEKTTSVIQNLAQPCMECGSCTFEDFLIVFKNMANLGLGLIGPLLVLILIIAGLVFLFSHGNQELVDRGKKIISGALVGMTIVFSAWLIINTIVTVSVKNQKILGTAWFSYNTVANPMACPQLAVTTDSNTTTTDQESITCTNPTGQCDSLSCDPVNPGDGCDKTRVNQLDSLISFGVKRSGTTICSGVNTVNLLKAIVASESDGVVDIGSNDNKSAGPFQLTPDIFKKYKKGCQEEDVEKFFWFWETDGNIFKWLRKKSTVDDQACIATKFIRNLASTCGCDARQLAAGYNGGAGACQTSKDCKTCSMCPNQKQSSTRIWECLWDNTQHTTCNKDRPKGSYAFTRIYAPKVEYCYSSVFK